MLPALVVPQPVPLRHWPLQYPELVAFYTKIAELPNIKAYLPNRLEKINGNSLG